MNIKLSMHFNKKIKKKKIIYHRDCFLVSCSIHIVLIFVTRANFALFKRHIIICQLTLAVLQR